MSTITDTQAKAIADLDVDTSDMVEFGEVARNVLNQQCQYASRYITGLGDTPVLADDLRIEGREKDYHSLTIHKDDVETFVERVNEYRNQHYVAP